MITSTRPYHPVLRQYIDYYYFQESNFITSNSYRYFPNLHTTISVYRDSLSLPTETGNCVLPTRPGHLTKLITTPVLGPKTIVQTGRISKLAIVFFSHGINYFIGQPLGKITGGSISPLRGFDPAFDWAVQEVFEANQLEEKVQVLDRYFVRLLKNTVHPKFEQARKLVEGNDQQSLQAIAERLRLNRRSLHKWFRLFTNCSPEHYRNVAKFRASIHQKLHRPEILLSEIAHEHYADQSHFIKKVKQFTHLTPTRFFNKVQRVGEQATFWTVNS